MVAHRDGNEEYPTAGKERRVVEGLPDGVATPFVICV